MGSKLENTVFFAANEGGHFAQLMKLSPLFDKYKSVVVTDNHRANKEIPALKNVAEIEFAMGFAHRRLELVNKENISRWNYLGGYLKMFRQTFRIWKKHRPKVIISTGSNIAVPLFFIGKLYGSKLVYIETRARVYGKSVTGKLLTHIADRIIVQWPEMVDVYKGKAEYYGTLV